jgi:hypothetical protein
VVIFTKTVKRKLKMRFPFELIQNVRNKIEPKKALQSSSGLPGLLKSCTGV